MEVNTRASSNFLLTNQNHCDIDSLNWSSGISSNSVHYTQFVLYIILLLLRFLLLLLLLVFFFSFFLLHSPARKNFQWNWVSSRKRDTPYLFIRIVQGFFKWKRRIKINKFTNSFIFQAIQIAWAQQWRMWSIFLLDSFGISFKNERMNERESERANKRKLLRFTLHNVVVWFNLWILYICFVYTPI